VLQCLQKGPNVSLEERESLKLLRKETKLVFLQLLANPDTPSKLEENKGLQRPLTDTLKQYDDLLREPKGLSPIRLHDNSFPYQYPFYFESCCDDPFFFFIYKHKWIITVARLLVAEPTYDTYP